MYVSFGSQVTVLEGSSELISREDRDIADSVREVLEQKGIVFKLNARVQSVKDSDVIYRDAVTGEEHQLHGIPWLLFFTLKGSKNGRFIKGRSYYNDPWRPW